MTTRAILERLAAELTDQQFHAFILREVEGWTYERIGQRLGCSKQTAHGHHRAATRRLQQLQRDGAWPTT